jgi:hypothetical protein
MWDVIVKTRPKPKPKKKVKVRFTISVKKDVTQADLDAIGRKVQEASDLVFQLTRGLSWIDKATIRDKSDKGDVIVDPPADGKRVELKKRKWLKVTDKVSAEEIAFAVLHLELGADPILDKDRQCLMNLEKLKDGKPDKVICPATLTALKRKLPDLKPDLKIKGTPPKVELKFKDQ